jgi:sugar phosphate isomerase/epimerase
MSTPEVFFASVSIEPNRWTPGRVPSLKISPWLGRASSDGFDGLECWANHAAFDEEERRAIADGPLPVAVFNAYDTFEATDESRAARERTIGLIRALGASAVKFNLGRDRNRYEEYLGELEGWIETLPGNVTPLCECHSGTVLETPETAAALLSALPEAGIGLIVHAFSIPEEELSAWFTATGGAVRHIHVQTREGLLERREAWAEARLRLLHSVGFEGSFTIEFAEGTAEPGETPELLYERCVRDMRFIKTRW